MIHLACCIGETIASLFRRNDRSEAKKRELLSACAAAGVAVAFGGNLDFAKPF